ncbi:hypothetical protein SAMN05443574_1129 [Haloarcula vallismortis]|uniref:DUF7344 domain-containing protein n=2 Tax=Haloarcula vallismortis TaxID=28442 RepID=M0J0W9_HALVA|nr:hypothetical protein [Haloarcula vallismortis]EMA01370.1 hypothetical protein C437_16766 [Haloarcula vallismortis ATCC 29715]SDX01802.1 hypothetical protein SAMN05443574_1129 [Haloarcula vallismortis]
MSIAETASEPTETETAESTTDESLSGDSPSDDGLTRDDLFHVLQCRRRRLVLKYLHEHPGDEPADMSDIAEHIAALEHDTTVDSLRSKQRQRVYIALYQSHLPKMDDAGVINYNQDRGLVEATALANSFDKYLDEEPSLLSTPAAESTLSAGPVTNHGRTDGHTSPSERWSSRYLGTACATLVAAGGLALSETTVSGVAVALVVSVVFVALAVSHRLSLSTPKSLSDRLRAALGTER